MSHPGKWYVCCTCTGPSHINVQTKVFRHQSSWEIVPVQSSWFGDCYINNYNNAGLGESPNKESL